MVELDPTPHMSQETLKKSSGKPNTKTFEQYDYINDTWASGRVSILIRKNIPQNKINIHLQAIEVLAILHWTVFKCSLYILLYDLINKKKLFDKMTPKIIYLDGRF